MTGAEDVTQYLLITRRVWAIVDCQRRYDQTLFPFLENKLTRIAGDLCQTYVQQ